MSLTLGARMGLLAEFMRVIYEKLIKKNGRKPNLPSKMNSKISNLITVSDCKSAPKMVDKWTPKITVPEPFSMTVREETNPQPPRHTRASLGFQKFIWIDF